MLTDGCTDGRKVDGQKVITIAHPEHSSGELKIEEIVEEMKEMDREERETGMKSGETEEIKTFPLYPYLLQGKQVLSNCKPISVGCPGD